MGARGFDDEAAPQEDLGGIAEGGPTKDGAGRDGGGHDGGQSPGRVPARRAVERPGTYGVRRSANGRRRNQRTWLSSSVDPAKSASAATANSCVWFTPTPCHA